MNTLELGVLISGRGSNLQSILDAVDEGRLAARVRVVISNRANAPGLERARAAGVPTVVISHKDYDSRIAFDEQLIKALRDHGVEWVVLAGFMRILSETFTGAFEHRIINIHPSLLPSFVGLDAQQQALDYGVRVTGCTVHLVDGTLDGGPILSQAVMAVRGEESRGEMAQRLLGYEHELLVQTLVWIAEGRLEIEPNPSKGRIVTRIKGVTPVLGIADV